MPERPTLAAQARHAGMLLRWFVDWWSGELAALIPERLRRHLDSAASRLVVVIDNGQALLLLENGKAPERLQSFDLTAHGSAAEIRALLRRCRLASAVAEGRVETCVRIPEDKALRATIELPLAAESNLDEVISFELDRLTPFKADQVYFAPRITGRDLATKRLTVELTLVPRPVADQALALVGDRLGLPAARLDVAAGQGRSAVSANLLPRSLLPRRPGTGALAHALAAVAVCLAIVAAYLPLARLQREAAAATQEFASVRAAIALQRQIEELRKEQRFLVDRKREAPTVSNLLVETTHVLPDDTFLSSWQLTGTEIQLGGTTRSAAALIPLLEQSHGFRETAFRTPVTQDPVTGRESFHIAAQAAGAEHAP